MKKAFIELEIIPIQEYYASNLEVEVDNFVPMENINAFITSEKLNSLEQVLLISDFLISDNQFLNAITNVHKFNFSKIEKLLSHFKKIHYGYANGELVYIQLACAKKKSLELLGKIISQNQISTFVKEVYLMPNVDNSYCTMLSNLPRKENLKTLLINSELVLPLNKSEVKEAKDIIDFFSTCYSNGHTVTPNNLICRDDIIKNFGVRLFAHIYKTIFIVYDTETNLVLNLNGSNKVNFI